MFNSLIFARYYSSINLAPDIHHNFRTTNPLPLPSRDNDQRKRSSLNSALPRPLTYFSTRFFPPDLVVRVMSREGDEKNTPSSSIARRTRARSPSIANYYKHPPVYPILINRNRASRAVLR